MNSTDIAAIKPGDVIRARRYGNRTVRAYTVAAVSQFAPETTDTFICRAFPWGGGNRGSQHMTFDAASIEMVRSVDGVCA